MKKIALVFLMSCICLLVFIPFANGQDFKVIEPCLDPGYGYNIITCWPHSYYPSLSADGRYIAYSTWVPDSSGLVLLYDRMTEKNELISVRYDGTLGGGNRQPVISADGRYVAFVGSYRAILDPNSTMPYMQASVLLRDRIQGTTELVSVSLSGRPSNRGAGNYFNPSISISGDGRYVAFTSLSTDLVPNDTVGNNDIFVRDRLLGETNKVSINDDGSQLYNHTGSTVAMSNDGRYIMFSSSIINNQAYSGLLILHDMETGINEKICTAPNGESADSSCQSNAISSDGRYVVFMSTATNLMPGLNDGGLHIYIKDRTTGVMETVTLPENAWIDNSIWNFPEQPQISGNGKYIVFSAFISTEVGVFRDIFLYDIESKNLKNITEGYYSFYTEGINPSYGGRSWNPAINYDGSVIAFTSINIQFDPTAVSNDYKIYIYTNSDSNQPPVANAGTDITVGLQGCATATIALNGYGSSDPNGDALIYEWTGSFGTAYGVSPTVTVPAGTSTITLLVSDGKGGISTDTVIITAKDLTPPQTTANIVNGTIGNDEWYVSNVTIGLNSTDDCSGVREIHYSIDGVEQPIVYASTATFTISQDGRHTVSFWAIDNEGNIEQVQSTPIKTEVTPPTTVPNVTSGGWSSSTCVNVILQSSSTESGVPVTEYSLDGGITWLAYSGEFQICGDGSATVSYRSISPAGSVESTKTIAINIDQTAPVIVIISPQATQYSLSSTLIIDYSILDVTSGVSSSSATLDSGSVINGQAISLLTLGLGMHTVTVSAQDVAGNMNSGTVQFEVIATPASLADLVMYYLQNGFITNEGLANALISKAENAAQSLSKGNTTATINLLNAFINEVEAQRGNQISIEVADILIAAAQDAISRL